MMVDLTRSMVVLLTNMFIGNKEVKMELEQENGVDVKIEFGDDTSTVINKELFDLIKSEDKNDGNVSDNINHYFAKKFVAELAYYGLDFYFANNVGVAMGTLAHNLREELFSKTFKCTGGDTINLKLLVTLDKA
jgi:hypothetical protein